MLEEVTKGLEEGTDSKPIPREELKGRPSRSVASIVTGHTGKKYKGPFVRPFFRPPGR